MHSAQPPSQEISLEQVAQNVRMAVEHRKMLTARLMQIAAEAGCSPIDIFPPQVLREAVKELPKNEARTVLIEYFDTAAGKGWTKHGALPTEAMKAARQFDKANPKLTPLRMDQFKITDADGPEIALKLKRDVRTISNKVIKYADLVNATASQQAA